jgi:hypothetical protein
MTPLMSPELTLIFSLRVVARLEAAVAIGGVQRRVATVDGGTYSGPKLKGAVAPGGDDWLFSRPDAIREIDARMVLREEGDGEVILMRYRGYRTAQPDVLSRAIAGQKVNPEAFVYRTAHWFESSGRCAWLNDIVGVGLGAHDAEGLLYRVYQVA